MERNGCVEFLVLVVEQTGTYCRYRITNDILVLECTHDMIEQAAGGIKAAA